MHNKKIFTGVMAALVTPLDGRGRVNRAAVRALVEEQLRAGMAGFYVCGSTGEGPVLPAAVRRDMCEAVLEANAGRGRVIVQTGAIVCAESFELARHAAQSGADGISSVPPSFYCRYTRREIIDYYKRLAGVSELPLLLYAIPLLPMDDVPGVVNELLKVPNIIGLKDTRGNYYEMWRLRQLNGGDINIINGPDETLLCGLAMGADGGIGATYNVMPGLYAALYREFQAGNFGAARELQWRINRIIQVILGHAKSSCIGTVKLALRLRGMDAGAQCYPAEDFSEAEVAAFRRALDEAGLPPA